MKKHRWFPKILKSDDVLLFSAGWRRFQSLPMYALEDRSNARYVSTRLLCCLVLGSVSFLQGSCLRTSLGGPRHTFFLFCRPTNSRIADHLGGTTPLQREETVLCLEGAADLSPTFHWVGRSFLEASTQPLVLSLGSPGGLLSRGLSPSSYAERTCGCSSGLGPFFRERSCTSTEIVVSLRFPSRVCGRVRYLKYTPEHLHCLAYFWAPALPPATPVLAIRDTRATANFRVSATGLVLQTSPSAQLSKKLKLLGEPKKIFKNTAFIKGMFNSDLEVNMCIGSSSQSLFLSLQKP